jgi:hypothetical protein
VETEIHFNIFFFALTNTPSVWRSYFYTNIIYVLNYFIFYREHLAESLGQDGGAGTRVVEKFLQLLQLVMAEPSASFKRFVPSTISLCLDHVYPLVYFILCNFP